jgi:hypothetical protein
MTTVTPKRLVMQVIPISAGTVYTVPAGTTTIVENIDITNTLTSAVKFYVNFVPTGNIATTANALFSNRSLPSLSYASWQGNAVLTAGDKISLIASASGVCCIINGVEIV